MAHDAGRPSRLARRLFHHVQKFPGLRTGAPDLRLKDLRVLGNGASVVGTVVCYQGRNQRLTSTMWVHMS